MPFNPKRPWLLFTVSGSKASTSRPGFHQQIVFAKDIQITEQHKIRKRSKAQRSDLFFREDSLRVVRRLVRLEGLAQQRQVPQSDLAVQFQVQRQDPLPHLTEDEVKAAFIRLVNKLSTDREFYITELTAIKNRLADTTELEKERRILDEQLGIDAKAVNDLIAQNARVAQNQTEYNERYEALVSRYEETERRRDELADRINQIMIRRRKLERFIENVEGLPELYTEFDAGQWAALVDSMTVHAKDRITFTLTCGMEIEE